MSCMHDEGAARCSSRAAPRASALCGARVAHADAALRRRARRPSCARERSGELQRLIETALAQPFAAQAASARSHRAGRIDAQLGQQQVGEQRRSREIAANT